MKNDNNSFTVIEVIVVIAIVYIVALIATYPVLNNIIWRFTHLLFLSFME